MDWHEYFVDWREMFLIKCHVLDRSFVGVSVLQWIAVSYNGLQCTDRSFVDVSVLRCVAVRCSVLERSFVGVSVLQCVAVHCSAL